MEYSHCAERGGETGHAGDTGWLSHRPRCHEALTAGSALHGMHDLWWTKKLWETSGTRDESRERERVDVGSHCVDGWLDYDDGLIHVRRRRGTT